MEYWVKNKEERPCPARSDWEIKARVDKGHSLIGVNLPPNPQNAVSRVHKPGKIQDKLVTNLAVHGHSNLVRRWKINSKASYSQKASLRTEIR